MSEAIADTDALIGAYLRERANLARAGAVDRVAQVDAELSRLGHTAPLPAPAANPSRKQPPRGRSSRPAETA